MATILLVSINYSPEETGIGPYSTGLAEHLAGAGHDVTVVTGMPHYPAWEVEAAYRGDGARTRPATVFGSSVGGTSFRPVRARLVVRYTKGRSWPTPRLGG